MQNLCNEVIGGSSPTQDVQLYIWKDVEVESLVGIDEKSGQETLFEPDPVFQQELQLLAENYLEILESLNEDEPIQSAISLSDSMDGASQQVEGTAQIISLDDAFKKMMNGIVQTADSADGANEEITPEPDDPLLCGRIENALKPLHLEDLRKSGLSDRTIDMMRCVSMDIYEIHNKIKGNRDLAPMWHGATGYAIPYTDVAGEPVQTRYRMFWKESVMNDGSKPPKYLSPKDAVTQIYVPPGFDQIKESYLIITEGEKKAAKAVQEGFPCVALAGVHMWADSEERRKHVGDALSYRSKLVEELQRLARHKKCLILFDKDVFPKPQVFSAAEKLKDALLFQSSNWCRVMGMPIPKAGEGKKWGIDDLLLTEGGKKRLNAAINAEIKLSSDELSPVFKLQYMEKNGTPYHYVVKNNSLSQDPDLVQIIKEEPKQDEEGATYTARIDVSNARAWVSRVINSLDDDHVLYELTYFRHGENEPKTLLGEAEILSVSPNKDDLLAKFGAKVLPKHKTAMEEFLVNCQKYGIKYGVVQKVFGTTKRGWRDGDHRVVDNAFVMANRVITETHTYAGDARDNAVVPIDSGSDEALRQALVCKGSFDVWKRAIEDHVLHSTIPSLMFGAGLAGLLRKWCSGSENFIFHLYGSSSGGKTTAMKAPASAWGNPTRLIDTWKATTNGLERKAVGRNDMALFLDEAGMAAEQDLEGAIYALGNGGEKMRATKDARERVTSKYTLVALSTGEKQLVRGTKFVGQEARALEVRADLFGKLWRTIDNALQAEDLNRVLDENYGHAIEPMIRGMLEMTSKDPNSIQRLWSDRTEEIRSKIHKVEPHILRRLKHFSLCLTALEIFLIKVMEWCPEMVDDKMDELKEQIVLKLIHLDTDQFKQGENLGILQHFTDQIAVKQMNFVTDKKNGQIPNELYGSIEESLVFCIPGRLGEMMKPFDNARLIQAAESIGALLTRKHGKKKTISHRIGGARPDCYVFDISKIEEVLYKDE